MAAYACWLAESPVALEGVNGDHELPTREALTRPYRGLHDVTR